VKNAKRSSELDGDIPVHALGCATKANIINNKNTQQLNNHNSRRNKQPFLTIMYTPELLQGSAYESTWVISLVHLRTLARLPLGQQKAHVCVTRMRRYTACVNSRYN
jgi:hypothetical protein